mgnify:CR=1 FL=1|jgi:hypothetical protein
MCTKRQRDNKCPFSGLFLKSEQRAIKSESFDYLSHFWLATVQEVLQADWQEA